ncbi:MAG: ATP-binding protein [Prevotella sp.]|nr:ATP-binding protein [Prevotella sp.]
MNPFKFGVLVDDEFFTDRNDELKEVQWTLNSENHLILISPRRFGKSSLVAKAVKASGRPCISLNMQNMLSVDDFASKLLRELFRLYPMERIKHLMSHFRIVPTVSTNPVTNGVDVSFQPVINSMVLLEDAMSLIEKVSTENKRLIVVLDEFQEILNIRTGLDKQLRSIMQEQEHLNYVLLGSQESMMAEIFERKKSPFYHFGKLMHLDKIPYDDFKEYVSARLPSKGEKDLNGIVEEILDFTSLHPYYTQQLSAQVWDMMTYENLTDGVVWEAISKIVRTHDLDFERLWLNFNRTDRSIMISLSKGFNPLQNRQVATSTSFSGIKRLMKAGYVIRVNDYEIEDPFFKEWIIRFCN